MLSLELLDNIGLVEIMLSGVVFNVLVRVVRQHRFGRNYAQRGISFSTKMGFEGKFLLFSVYIFAINY